MYEITNDFNLFYTKDLKSYIEKQETNKEKRIQKIKDTADKIQDITTTIIGLFCVFGYSFMTMTEIEFALLILAYFCIALSSAIIIEKITNIKIKAIKSEYKKLPTTILPIFLSNFKLALTEEKNITIEEFNKIGLFPDATTCRKHISFKDETFNKALIFDIIFSHTIMDNINALYVTDYRGIIIKIELDRSYNFIFVKDFENKFQKHRRL